VANLVDYNRLTEDLKSVLDTLIPKEMNVQTRQGEWFTMRILPYRTMNNVIEGAVITFVNISEMIKAYVRLEELKKAHAALQESEQRYHSVVTALSEGVVLHARDGRIVAWNPAAERIFGLSGQEIRERTTLDPRWRTIHEDGSPFPAETRPSQTVFRTGVPQKDVIMGITKPDGTLAWISVNAEPICAAGEAVPKSVVISFSDITERRRIAEALRVANDYLRLAVVVRDVHDAVTLQGLDGRMLAWNPGAERMYGWSEAEALQMNVLARIPPAQQQNALARIHALSQAKTIEPYHTQRLTKGGAVVEVSINATALLDEAGQVYAISTTERAIEGENHD
jgi:PAS domain S-box-containing protein